MRIGYYQFSPEFGNIDRNREEMIANLRDAEADIIVLPELATSGYFFTGKKEAEELSETVPGRTTDAFSELSVKTGTRYVLGMPEKSEDGIFNSAVMTGPGGVEAVYRKAHLFGDEHKYFSPGEEFIITEVKNIKIGLLVCFDHMFPEAARTLALRGAQVICHPSNLVLPEYGQLTTRVRALENRVFWILANRTGTEKREGKELRYTGESQIISPKGEILHRGPSERSELYITEINPSKALNKHVTPSNNILKDRRTDIYSL